MGTGHSQLFAQWRAVICGSHDYFGLSVHNGPEVEGEEAIVEVATGFQIRNSEDLPALGKQRWK